MSGIVAGVKILEGGAIKEIGRDELEFGYRSSCIKGKPVTGITLELVPGSYDDIKNRTAEFIRARNSRQPMEYPSCGSVFKRPAVKSGEEPLYASKMIDECGLKGLRSGGAQISEKHAGFIINTGGAKAKDVMTLISIIKNSVFEKFSIILEEEVIYVGF
jgi:UDP-N-acetylmuramate dehydrogenase